MKINFNDDIPIYKQLLEELKFCIINGEYKLGMKLPSVRDLASEFKINPNTVQKALNELESVGLIETKRTLGKFVTSNKNILIKENNILKKEILDNVFGNLEKYNIDYDIIIKYINDRRNI